MPDKRQVVEVASAKSPNPTSYCESPLQLILSRLWTIPLDAILCPMSATRHEQKDAASCPE